MTEGTDTPKKQRRRILRQGVVVSDKMDKTLTVKVDRLVKHPLYGKYVKQKTILKAHDAANVCFVGDVVELEFSRALSKTKRWRLVRVVKQGPASQVAEAARTSAGGES